MNKEWALKEPVSLESKKQFAEIQPLILQLLINRGLNTQDKIDEFLHPDYGQDILDPFLFPDMAKAVARIYKAVEKKEKIYIYGDYDADGVTSTVLIANVLQTMGARYDVYIPHREKEGYGLNLKAIKYLVRKKAKLIITVDCGISNKKEIALANKKKIDVIVTDHHHEPLELPEAYAIINPKVKKCNYPYYELAGVGVAFKLAQGIISSDKKNIFSPGYEKWLLDLVAIGTVTDVMPLIGENRTLLKFGLIVLNKTKRQGLKMLAQKADIWPITEEELMNSENIGFVLGPRLNAAGRMDHANVSYELLTSEKDKELEKLVNNLEKNNQKRQSEVEKIINEIKLKAKYLDKRLLILESGKWPVGIIGLVSGKLKDQFNRPAIVIGKAGRRLIGSGRSIKEFNLIEALKTMPELFTVFGGHAAAAGFTLKNKKALPEFEKRITELAERQLKGKNLLPKIDIDAELNLADLNWELFDQIQEFEPFGQANPKPLFLIKNLIVESVRTVGNGNKHLKLYLKHEEMTKSFEAIGFGMGEHIEKIKIGDKMDIVCEINLNQFNGNRKLELKIVDWQPIISLSDKDSLKSKI
ncbi:single-stranded-DNA-specific exonuclease RecJ [Candidatus Falkowbacteria bacterium]|nr:single-stranded-DNA-specific exonuclease RecJ [Candidatus Falkowbacteria bacterium]